ncbi:hypothetical protein Hanom_Chr12g01083351 [Helianthus anomalus]
MARWMAYRYFSPYNSYVFEKKIIQKSYYNNHVFNTYLCVTVTIYTFNYALNENG